MDVVINKAEIKKKTKHSMLYKNKTRSDANNILQTDITVFGVPQNKNCNIIKIIQIFSIQKWELVHTLKFLPL